MDKNDFLDFESGLLSGRVEENFLQQLIDTKQLDGLPAKYRLRAQKLADEGRVSLN